MNILELAVHSNAKHPRSCWYIVLSDKDHHADPLPHSNVVIEYVLKDNVLRRGILTFLNNNLVLQEFAYPTHPKLIIHSNVSPLKDLVMWRYLDRDNKPVPIQR